jgi:hypothetical protein
VFADAEETVIDREGGSTRKPGKATSAASDRSIKKPPEPQTSGQEPPRRHPPPRRLAGVKRRGGGRKKASPDDQGSGGGIAGGNGALNGPRRATRGFARFLLALSGRRRLCLCSPLLRRGHSCTTRSSEISGNPAPSTLYFLLPLLFLPSSTSGGAGSWPYVPV